MKYVCYSLVFLPLAIFSSLSLRAMHTENQALLDAVYKQDIEQVRCLLESNKVDVNYQSVNFGISCPYEQPIRSALHLAVYIGNTDLIKLLLQAGANPNIHDQASDTPLHSACRSKKTALPEIVSLLIEYGADVNAQNNLQQSPLHVAVEEHNYTAVQLLLSAPNIDSTLKDHRGQTALESAQNYSSLSDQQAQNITQSLGLHTGQLLWSVLQKSSQASKQRIINLLTFDTMSLKKMLVKYVKAHRDQFSDEQIAQLPADLELS